MIIRVTRTVERAGRAGYPSHSDIGFKPEFRVNRTRRLSESLGQAKLTGYPSPLDIGERCTRWSSESLGQFTR